MSGSRTWQALAACLLIALVYWAYWTLFPAMTAGSVGNDVLFLADGARRLAAGQIPHVDFSLPTGLLPYLNYLWAGQAFPYFPAYMGAHLIGFLWLVPLLTLAMAQMPHRWMALALAVLVAIAALLPFNITRNEPYGIAFFASYNRLGTALSMVWLAWLFRAGRQPTWLNAIIIAYALTLAFFVKIVLTGVILAPLAVLAVSNRSWRWPAFAGLALSGLCLLGLNLSGDWVGAYLADIRSMSRVNVGAAPYFLVSFLFKTLLLQMLVAALILWLLAERWREDGWKQVGPPLAMLAAVAALSFSESQATGGLEFSAALGLLFAPGLIGKPAKLPRACLLTAAISLTAGPLLIGAFENMTALLVKRQGQTIAVSWVSRYLPHTTVPEPMLRKATATATLWERGGETLAALEAAGPDVINRSAPDLYLSQWAGVDRALAWIDEDERKALGAVATLANVDLFGLALDAKPAKGLKIVHDIGRTIRPLGTGEARAYLAGADTVFQPRCLIDEAPGSELMSGWFTQVLEDDFSGQVLTPCWTMYRRKR